MNIKVFSVAMFIAFWFSFYVRNYSTDLQKEVLLTMLIFQITYFASKEIHQYYINKKMVNDVKVEN